MGCHGNHAFSHITDRFIFGQPFSQLEVPGNNLVNMKNCPEGAR